MNADAQLNIDQDGDKTVLSPSGDWVARSVGQFDAIVRDLRDRADPDRLVIDLKNLGRIDTTGALTLGQALDRCGAPDADFHFRGQHRTARSLMKLVRDTTQPCPAPPSRGPGVLEMLTRLGEGLMRGAREVLASLSFFGELLATFVRIGFTPMRMRVTPTVAVMEDVGVNALPIVAILSFFVGAVVAYLGANILQQQLGAPVLAAQLVGFAVVREFGVVITAILLAGRSDSAFTAQIGAMGMQQEIDAMRAMGIDPFEALVVPRVVACVIMLPLLAFGAMVSGLIGGMMALWASADIAPGLFLNQVADNVRVQDFWAGMAKAPVFALVIAIIGCRHGLQVRRDVESLGHHVTASVVQSIFAVIVLDAIFALLYLELGI